MSRHIRFLTVYPMNLRLPIHPGLFRYIPLLTLFFGLLLPASGLSTAQGIEVVVETPQLTPPYSTCETSYWYTISNNRGYTSYLTLNVSVPADSTNHGEWHPSITQPGYYRVEAYIPDHDTIYWCKTNNPKEHDTTQAHYSIHHANGISNPIVSQNPLGNQWLYLGEYYFKAGNLGYVSLTDLSGESAYSTTVSFSAMRFTFTRPNRPNYYLPLVRQNEPTGQLLPYAGVIQGQGFDACHLPEISEMQTWWSQSPYTFYGLYLGGIHLPSICTVANSAWVNAVHQQGWSFAPIWVGPQAPCTDYHYKMSADPAVSYQEGRHEAEAASAAAVTSGLAKSGTGGTIIYYDLEAYGIYTPECRDPVSAFMNGWTERLHELGNFAGGYGTRNSYPWDWATITNIPDSIWGASWYTSTYDPKASVLNISWLEGLWTNHQRIRQYAGDHTERWGGIKFALDSNVADGVVALAPTQTITSAVGLSAPSIMDTGWLSAEQGWLVIGTNLYWTGDRGKNWQDISPAPTQLAYFLPTGKAWALGSQDQDNLSLYYSYLWGQSWKRFELHLPPGAWHPLQMRFTTSASGWIVMQKETSQAFDIALLLKTSDGGVSWQSLELPSAAPIRFITPSEGWMLNRGGDTIYKTWDGGVTWLPTRPERYLLAQASIPDDSILYGWQGDSLGWSVTSIGSCSGEKSTPGFTCQVENSLKQTLDGGQTWSAIPLLAQSPNLP